MREVQDHYFKQAKREGYVSRAAYKLLEIDDRRKVLRPGDRVLDCGAAPGSWLQVASKRVGPKGMVVGIDLQPFRHQFSQPNIRTLQGDFTTTPADALLALANTTPEQRFDVVLSDMAPATSGDPSGDHFRSVRLCDSLLDRCPLLLRQGGNLVMKVFEGQAYPDLLNRTRTMFENVKGFKPKASRSESREMFIVAHGFRAAAADQPMNAHQPEIQPARQTPAGRPSTGWTR